MDLPTAVTYCKCQWNYKKELHRSDLFPQICDHDNSKSTFSNSIVSLASMIKLGSCTLMVISIMIVTERYRPNGTSAQTQSY